MIVADVLRKKGSAVISVTPGHTLRAASRVACEHRIGALLVMGDEDTLVGIITERDILWQCCIGADLDRVRVGSVMVRDVVVGLEEDDLHYTMNTMTERRVRHLPVMRGDKVVGIVSIGDIVNALRRERAQEVRYLRDYLGGRYW